MTELEFESLESASKAQALSLGEACEQISQLLPKPLSLSPTAFHLLTCPHSQNSCSSLGQDELLPSLLNPIPHILPWGLLVCALQCISRPSPTVVFFIYNRAQTSPFKKDPSPPFSARNLSATKPSLRKSASVCFSAQHPFSLLGTEAQFSCGPTVSSSVHLPGLLASQISSLSQPVPACPSLPQHIVVAPATGIGLGMGM